MLWEHSCGREKNSQKQSHGESDCKTDGKGWQYNHHHHQQQQQQQSSGSNSSGSSDRFGTLTVTIQEVVIFTPSFKRIWPFRIAPTKCIPTKTN